MNGFERLAKYYDQFVGADYPRIVRFIDQKIKQYMPDASLICDVGCGSGTVTLGLLNQNYDMIGVDGSIDMLTEALNKRASLPNGEKALFLCQQLPDFELYGTVDAIVSTLDTLNYLTNPDDLKTLFYWFKNYLNPNGLLIFDINSLYKYQSILNGHCAIYEDDGIFLSWRSSFEDNLCDHQLTYFTPSAKGYDRNDEAQQQRYYSTDHIQGLLTEFGFELIGIYDDYKNQMPTETTQRLTFIAKAIKE